MKTSLLCLSLLTAVTFIATTVLPASAATAAAPNESIRRHPLKGVVVAVDAEQSALRVKHETIPGVMRAMTMFFKVDTETLKRVKAGDAITALMYRKDDEWRLDDVKVVPPQKN